MKLYNTLSRNIEEIKPLDATALHMYSCGPTVYARIHIGNLASFIYADTLRRALAGSGVPVKHVMNITDVDDKTIRSSLEQYGHLGSMEALHKLTEDYTNLFWEDMKTVGNDVDAVTFVKATDYIAAMQQLIRELLKADFAYIADDGVYFSIDAYKKSGKVYGQLSKITGNSTSESRIQNDEYDKESVHDFALWKKQKSGEPAWDFDIDGHAMTGRPGWHIECSAMSRTLLGQPFDIHTGGIDLIFPHHENEIAQSTAASDNKVFANVFVHNEHMLIDGQKMSKSLNNFYTLEDIKTKDFEALALRVLVLQSHYRSQAHFSWENLTSAKNRLQDLRTLAVLRWQTKALQSDDTKSSALKNVDNELSRLFSDDLNTPEAFAYLSKLSTQLQTSLIGADERELFEEVLKAIDYYFGLNLLAQADITEEQKNVIQERETARKAKNWQQSDTLRAKLEDQGIGLRDSSNGAIWFRL